MDRRFAEIDALKAAGILVVIWIHCMPSPFSSGISPIEVWLGHLTRFAVPGFLFASGFLYATPASRSLATAGRRLRRILVPYGIASLLAQLWHAWMRRPTTTGGWLTDLLLAASFAPYYYVLLIVGLVVLTPLLARWPRSVGALCVGLLPAQWYFDAAFPPLALHPFWQIRNPLLWAAYFLVGWWVRIHYAAIAARLAAHRGPVLVALALAVIGLSALCGVPASRVAVRTAAWLDIYAILALIFAATCGRPGPSAPIRLLSDATYPIYLVHLFFVYSAASWVEMRPGRADFDAIVTLWAAGVFGSLGVVVLARFALGARSRDWIGA